MGKDKTQKLRYWIAGGYAVPIALSLISAMVVAWNVGIVRREARDLQMSQTIFEDIAALGFNIQTVSRATRGYLLDPSPVSKQSYVTGVETVNELERSLQAEVRDEQQQQDLARLVELTENLEQTNQQIIDLVDAGQADRALAVWRADNGRAQVEEIVQLMNQVRSQEQAIVAASEEAQLAALNRLSWVVFGVTALSVLLAAAIGIWLVAAIAQRVNESASAVASSSAEIAATVEQQERTASQQAASVNETTATMDELSASSRQSAEQAQSAAEGAQNVLQLAEQGTRAVEKTLDGMGVLKSKVAAIAEQILHLSEQTSQIGNISGLVSDLANQTNMLALNAAVEAVRAGEHGRGFAVVAGEIRKLADQSKRSAERINALVSDVQSAINATVMVTDEGTKTVEESVAVARSTAETFAGMTDSMNNVAIGAQQISLNAKQQAVAIQQVVDAMNALNSAAKETASGISQVKLGTQNLNQAAVELKSVM